MKTQKQHRPRTKASPQRHAQYQVWRNEEVYAGADFKGWGTGEAEIGKGRIVGINGEWWKEEKGMWKGWRSYHWANRGDKWKPWSWFGEQGIFFHTHTGASTYVYSAPHIMSNMHKYVSIYMWHVLINLACFHLLKVCPIGDPLVLMHSKIPMNVAQCKIKTLVKPCEINLCFFITQLWISWVWVL